MVETVRRRRNMFTWSVIKAHKDTCRKYKEAYKKKLLNKKVGADVQQTLDVSKDDFVFDSCCAKCFVNVQNVTLIIHGWGNRKLHYYLSLLFVSFEYSIVIAYQKHKGMPEIKEWPNDCSFSLWRGSKVKAFIKAIGRISQPTSVSFEHGSLCYWFDSNIIFFGINEHFAIFLFSWIIFFPQDCEKELSVFNITLVRQQAEVEVRRMAVVEPTLMMAWLITLTVLWSYCYIMVTQVRKRFHITTPHTPNTHSRSRWHSGKRWYLHSGDTIVYHSAIDLLILYMWFIWLHEM